ncbi:TPA: DUF551 domain-containing protein [Escherichia coli]|nr:hypothetical protein PU08_21345 [Escherichia coli]HAX9732334.1 DUF551 domain-containing protein [Escherichia coli]HAY0190917.1 DUF551 domain-containing protein [Escherichia coli]HAY0397059.1 DUF551 domain-containing protein [Escherichia coli]HCJ5747262.1 DUF551 domain-containing protein [Escherichia coli]
MTTFTDKELIKEIKERIGSLDVRDNIERRAYEIALASLEAEPVAWKVTFTQIDREYNTFTGMYSDKAEVERWVRLHKACNFRADITPLYTAKPVPVTPDDWISCSERMPKGYADVLVTDGEHVEVKWWDESGYWNSWTELNSDIFADEITHWMPLPEPPL